MAGGRTARNHLLSLAQTNGIGQRRVDEVLGIVGLADVGGKRSKGFSLGMRQRLGIAAALLGDPQILMFDEPVNGLDPEGILWIRTLMRSLAAEGRTVLVSSHLMSEMEHTADHLLVIGRGRLIADSSMAEFIARGSGQAVNVRTPQPYALARAVAVAGASVSAAGIDTGLEICQADVLLAVLLLALSGGQLAAGQAGAASQAAFIAVTVLLAAAVVPRRRYPVAAFAAAAVIGAAQIAFGVGASQARPSCGTWPAASIRRCSTAASARPWASWPGPARSRSA